MTIVWHKWRDQWHFEGRYHEAGEARAVVDCIKDPGCECCSPRGAMSFEVEAIGRLCTLTEIAFADLTPLRRDRRSMFNLLGSTFDLYGDAVHVTKRISASLVEVYNDRIISYEVVGRRMT